MVINIILNNIYYVGWAIGTYKILYNIQAIFPTLLVLKLIYLSAYCGFPFLLKSNT